MIFISVLCPRHFRQNGVDLAGRHRQADAIIGDHAGVTLADPGRGQTGRSCDMLTPDKNSRLNQRMCLIQPLACIVQLHHLRGNGRQSPPAVCR